MRNKSPNPTSTNLKLDGIKLQIFNAKINYKNLYLYEIDSYFYKKHYKFLSNLNNIHVFNKDFIEVISNNILDKNEETIIVSNIAFNIFKKTITALIINRYLNISKIIVLIPKEIGISMIKEDCAFSKFISFFYNTKFEFDIPDNSFSRNIPFDTCVISMYKNNSFNIDIENINNFYKFIKFLFQSKRKIIRAILCERTTEDNIYKLRPHELNHKEIISLYKKYDHCRKNM